MKAITYSWNAICDYWNMAFRTRPEYYRKLRQPDGTFFEIRATQIVGGAILCVLGMTIDGVVLTTLFGIKLIPAMLRGLVEVTRAYFTTNDPIAMCVCAFPYIIGLVLVVGGIPAAYPILCLLSVLYGTRAAVIMYRRNSFTDGLRHIFHTLYVADVYSNELVFGEPACSCCFEYFKQWDFIEGRRIDLDANPLQIVLHHPDPPALVAQRAMDELKIPDPALAPPAVGEARIAALRIWSSFFTMCTVQGKTALEEKFCTRETIADQDPSWIVGLPALVILRAIKRSEKIAGIQLADSLIITEMNRPTDLASNVVYPWLIQIKQALATLALTDAEYAYVERWVVMGDDPVMSKLIVLPAGGISEARMQKIKRCTSLINGLATRVTQMPTFHRMFGEATLSILQL
jgi:hypothetical protein